MSDQELRELLRGQELRDSAINAAVARETEEAKDVILKCNKWIEEAKPLLERGGEAERERDQLRKALLEERELRDRWRETQASLRQENERLKQQLHAAQTEIHSYFDGGKEGK